jgi:CRP-like cAMP-binding protein
MCPRPTRLRKRHASESSAKPPKLSKRSQNGKREFDLDEFLAGSDVDMEIEMLPAETAIFSQGDAAETIFYIRKGQVKISVVSKQGKEAILVLLGPGEFLGEECIAGTHAVRLATANTMVETVLLKITKEEMMRALRREHELSSALVRFLLSRNARTQADLIDHLFNSSEKRLARVLLLLAQFGKDGKPEKVIPKLSQESLAEMVGTTRSRVSFFMNRFREMGFIKYNGDIEVHSSLLNVVLHD